MQRSLSRTKKRKAEAQCGSDQGVYLECHCTIVTAIVVEATPQPYEEENARNMDDSLECDTSQT